MLKAAKLQFMIRIAGYSLLHHIRNADTAEELKADPIEKKLAEYKQSG
jgi:hypothetical protein